MTIMEIFQKLQKMFAQITCFAPVILAFYVHFQSTLWTLAQIISETHH